MPYNGFLSLTKTLQNHHIRRTSSSLRVTVPYISLFNEGVSMCDISTKLNYPVYLIAKLVVEYVTGYKGKRLSDCMRNPSCPIFSLVDHATPHGTLDECVRQAIASDPMNGPRHDKYRRLLGVHYEVHLQRLLTRMSIPFITEDSLRILGASKTPDIVLQSPMGVKVHGDEEYRVITWIDSKAMFGDEITHKNDVVQQAEGYIHRYGPGMIIYWFGHATKDKLWEGVQGGGKGIVVTDKMPEERVWPNGKTEKGDGKNAVKRTAVNLPVVTGIRK